MQFLEGIRLAMVQIWTQKLKSFFSLLGVIIGVMFLIVVVSVVEGMDRYIREDVSSQVFGINTVTLQRWPEVNINTSSDEWRERMRYPRLTEGDASYLRERLPAMIRLGVQSGAEERSSATTAARPGTSSWWAPPTTSSGFGIGRWPEAGSSRHRRRTRERRSSCGWR